MPSDEIEVAVMDGDALIQRWACTVRMLPGGRRGVLWRGVMYAVQPGDRIDVNVPANDAAMAPRRMVLHGEQESWVLVEGMAAVLAAVASALRDGGITITRTGRWLGDPVDDIVFDWFLRCDGILDPDHVLRLLGTGSVATPAPAGRLTILEQQFIEMKAELARLEGALREAAQRASAPAVPDTCEPEPALLAALAQVAVLQERLDAAPRGPAAIVRTPPRIQEEIGTALTALRPDIVLLRDSLRVAVGEFSSRSGFWRALRELPAGGGRPEGWKAVRGAERWWERHVSTGQDDTGRAYARFDPGSRRWELLLGWKSEQARDVEWMRRQA